MAKCRLWVYNAEIFLWPLDTHSHQWFYRRSEIQKKCFLGHPNSYGYFKHYATQFHNTGNIHIGLLCHMRKLETWTLNLLTWTPQSWGQFENLDKTLQNIRLNFLQLNLLNSETSADLSNYVQNGEWDLVWEKMGWENLLKLDTI